VSAQADLFGPPPVLPKVLNRRGMGALPPGAVYVGRPSRWGNRYVIGPDGTRAEVIARYEAELRANSEAMAALSELRGKDLVCWCSPLPCHADVLLKLANR